MNIQFNEVTWYSKLGAILLFVLVVPILAFHIGSEYALVQGASHFGSGDIFEKEKAVISTEEGGLVGEEEWKMPKVIRFFDATVSAGIKDMSCEGGVCNFSNGFDTWSFTLPEGWSASFVDGVLTVEGEDSNDDPDLGPAVMEQRFKIDFNEQFSRHNFLYNTLSEGGPAGFYYFLQQWDISDEERTVINHHSRITGTTESYKPVGYTKAGYPIHHLTFSCSDAGPGRCDHDNLLGISDYDHLFVEVESGWSPKIIEVLKSFNYDASISRG